MPQFTAEELKSKSPEDLAILAERNDPRSAEGVLIEREWQRRARVAQHEYNKEQINLQHARNMELTKKQVRWIKFSAILTAAVTLLAVLLGWYLSEIRRPKHVKSNTAQIIHPQTKTSASVPHDEKKTVRTRD
ncbi:MAG TPA: hypothetical protein PK123_07560 [Bacteroidales bacterium]|nr:hypothetical protein [Bacteroidales bacterium]